MAGKVELELSDETLEFLRSKVASGEFASAGAVVEEAAERLRDGEGQLESWLREVGGPSYDEYLADPSQGRTLEQVEQELAEERALQQKIHA